MTTIRIEDYESVAEGEVPHGRGMFWLLLIAGILWILLSFLVLQFTYRSIVAISVMIGLILFLAAATEIALLFVARGWKWLHVLLAVLFALGGIMSFAYPGQTFGTLALIFGWYLLIKGTFDFVMALFLRGSAPYWWVGIITGIAEIALAFWAVGYVGRSAALLALWVGIGALMRGVMTIVAAFQIRHAVRGAA
jgi:uncharacterized membrane protein HdeD (DUF308 family)